VNRPWYQHLAWVAAAGALGLAVSGVFGGLLHLQRRAFILPDLVLVASLTYGFLRWNGIRIAALLRHNWRRGLVGGALFSAFSVFNVMASPASAAATGWRLAVDMLWSGGVYSLLDALLLSIIPVLAVSRAFASLGWEKRRVGLWAAALGASAFVTALYHVGFAEYGVYDILGAVVGNCIMTLGFLVTGSALTPMVAHLVLHGAGLLRGPTSMSVLPPHL
jgi:hypothetical protein